MWPMSITIVMMEGKTLHIQEASSQQVDLIREVLSAGRGVFEFTLNGQSYIVNCANVLYAEVSPADPKR